MELLKRLDEQVIDGEPHRPAPIGVAAEELADRFARFIADLVFFALEHQTIGVLGVPPRETADAEGREEFVGVEHNREDAAQAVFVDHGEQASPLLARS